MRLILCLTVCVLAAASWPGAGSAKAGELEVYRFERGTPERARLLDAARPIFEREIGGPIEFVVTTLNAFDGWAFGNVRVQRPGGQPIDWRRTKFAEAYAEGMFDAGGHVFLLRNDGGRWTEVEYAIGPTDVAWDWWRQQHNLPEALFTN